MTDQELQAITEGFKHISDRISDLEAKLKQQGELPAMKKDDGLKFDDLPDELKGKETDKSAEIKKAWYDKPLF
jgi:hypothetical protein